MDIAMGQTKFFADYFVHPYSRRWALFEGVFKTSYKN